VPIISLTVRQPSDTLAPDTARTASRRDSGVTGASTAAPAARKDIEGVFVVDTTTMTVRFKPVRVGVAGDEYFEVLNGLSEGQTIVAGPYQAIRDLRNGTRVRNSPSGRASSARPS